MPLENALNGTPGLKTLRSKSVLGLSSVVLLFEEGTDIHKVRQFVQERVAAEAPRLPSVAKPPVILQPLSSLSRVMKIGLSSKTMNQRDMTVLALWTIRPKLMSVPGVANVAIWGQRDKQFQVLVDPDRLRAEGVTLDQVVKAAGDATVLESGGYVDKPNQRIAVRHRSMIVDPEDLARTVVAFHGNSPTRIGDVAKVQIGSPPAIGDAIIVAKTIEGKSPSEGTPGLLLIVEKQPEGNTLEVSRRVEAALKDLAPGLEGMEVDPTIFRPASFVERAIANLKHALLIGCGLVVVILLLFLFDWRRPSSSLAVAFISLTAIPLSLVAAVLVLTAFGATLNTMVIAGLVIALGEVVDDAIIDVENIYRRLRENRALDTPRSAFRVVIDASTEVRSAVVYATAIVVMVFLPIFFLDGIAGSFFRPLALSYILAILASLVVALTVTPALAYMLLTWGKKADTLRTDPPLAGLLRKGYGLILPWLIGRPWLALGAVLATFVLCGAAATRFGSEFLPEFQETDFLMHFIAKPGASVEEMDRMTVLASKELRAIPGVQNFGSHIGRAEVADEVYGPNFTELWISIDPDVNYPATLKKIQVAMEGYPGMFCDVQTFLKERSKEVLSGSSASIVVRLFGPDLAVLRAKAKEAEKAMSGIEGVKDLKVESQTLLPQIEVRLRPEAAERYGLTPGHVRRATTTILKGTKVGEVYEGQKRFDVVVWGEPKCREDIAALQALPIDTPAGTQVRLRDVADVLVVPMPNEIKREAASRRLDITCNVQGRDLGSVAAEIEQKVKAWKYDQGYHPEFLGEAAARNESSRKLYWLGFFALLGVILLPGIIHEYLLMGLGQHKIDDLCTIIFSSGSTGDPKGVMLTHGNIAANVESVIQAIGPQPQDRLLSILPFFHSFGYTVTLWLPLQVGASTAFHANPLQAREIGELCKKHKCTIFVSTPTFLRSYLRRCDAGDFATLRILVCGAEKMPPTLAQEFKQKFGVLPLEGYGCTELSPVASVNVPDWQDGSTKQPGNKPGTIGLPIPGVAARVVNREMSQDLPSGQEGFLLMYGANVMKGYLGRDDLTQKKIVDGGWYITGDLGFIDEEGFITVTGREERFAKIGGEMVPLEKVEDELHRILKTNDKIFAVTAIPDAKKGERIIVLHLALPEMTPQDVWKQLNERGLPNIYVPGQRDFYQVAELPMLGTGKLDLKKCKQMAQQAAGNTE